MVDRPDYGGTRRVSEYVGVRTPMEPDAMRERIEKTVAEAPESEARYEERALSRNARAFARIGRALTGPGQDELAAGRRVLAEATWAYRDDQSFALHLAGSMRYGRDSEVRKVVPGIEGPIPRHPVMRQVAIGNAAIDIAHDYVERGDDHGLGASLGRSARLAALSDAYRMSSDVRKGNARLELEGRAVEVVADVRNYLSAGPEVVKALGRQADRMDKFNAMHQFKVPEGELPAGREDLREWIHGRLVADHEAARAGGLSDRAVVDKARDFAIYGGLEGDHSRDGTFVRPDAARTAARVAERDAAVRHAPEASQSRSVSRAAVIAASRAADRGR